MTIEELVEHWNKASDRDYQTMVDIYDTKRYHAALFFGHLTIEKLLKAAYVKNTKIPTPPKIHNLVSLARKSNLTLDDPKERMLDIVTTFNIETRYDDWKDTFYKLCTKEFTDENINRIKELRKWLKQTLAKS